MTTPTPEQIEAALSYIEDLNAPEPAWHDEELAEQTKTLRTAIASLQADIARQSNELGYLRRYEKQLQSDLINSREENNRLEEENCLMESELPRLKAEVERKDKAQGYRIKPLQLQPSSNGKNLYCHTAVGFYELGKDGFIYAPFIMKCPDYDFALAELNKDYMGKVLSLLTDAALAPLPAPDKEGVKG